MNDRRVSLGPYAGDRLFVGDIHNHCGISYGHGSIEDAYANARLQLDFASVTGHAWWHDMPRDDPEAGGLVDYHLRGFERLASCWDHVQDVTAAVHEDGQFVTFLSFEWHSAQFGDHCIYYNGHRGELSRANGLDELRSWLGELRANGTQVMALPHHIGYAQGRRGANWATFMPEFSPVVEIVSMHGCGESDDAPRPYLHVPGPRHTASTAMHGLSLGHRFGLIGSTDHHSAHPGSHGYGRIAAWAPELTRDAIWNAIAQRKVYALTGDPIVVGFNVNDTPMGGESKPSTARRIEAEVHAEAPLDYVELVRNGHPIHRVNRSELTSAESNGRFTGTVAFSVGWGTVGIEQPWDVTLRVEQGELIDVVPRLRGADIVAPAADAPAVYHFSEWERIDQNEVRLRTITHGNPNVVTDGTQGLNLHIDGDDRTQVVMDVNGAQSSHAIGILKEGSADHYLRWYRSAAYRLGRAVPEHELSTRLEFDDHSITSDWYHIRVRQTNDQWAWTSPVWVTAE